MKRLIVMKISKNPYVQADIEIMADNFDAHFLYGKSVLITGANGLIGSEIVFFLSYLNKKYDANIKIYALVRDISKAKEKYDCILEGLNFVVQDINKPIQTNDKINFIIHTAANTDSKKMLINPDETYQTIFNGMKNVLDFAKNNKVNSLIFLSSLEVYGNIFSDKKIEEDFISEINKNNPRNSYPLGKKDAENLCIEFVEKYDLDIKIARLSQTFGAGVNLCDNRVFAQFAKSIIEKKDIILHTAGNTTRNYCYLTDAVSAIFTILNFGQRGQIYNVANKNTVISIKEMATFLANKYGLKVVYQIDNVERGYNPEIKVVLNTNKLEAIGWSAKVGIEEMFERLIEGMKFEY